MTQATAIKSTSYPRFDLVQRAEHMVLLASFTVLALSGLPQKWPDSWWGETMIGVMGGIEFTRYIHHAAAIILVVLTIFHFFSVAYRIWVKRKRLTMLPSLDDVGDGLRSLGYNVGVVSRPPEMGRYTFGEKIEYWAVIWGTVVMILTGFLLWNPIAATNFLPGQAIPAAKAAHGGEALLAVLSIVTWHVYHVHIKHFNRSMFTGEISSHEMKEEHAKELAEIQAGTADRPVDPQAEQKRRMIFVPIAAVLAVGLLWSAIYFLTFEETAITTVPREEVPIFSPATPMPEGP
jgi:formate dehydrogenase gamma subunit